MDKPTAPETLNDAGKSLWDDVVGKYDLRVDELRTLRFACISLDLAEEFEQAWRDAGSPWYSTGSMGQEVEHPLIGSGDKQRKAADAFLKRLNLPDDPAGAKPNQQRTAANSRWAQAHGKGA